MIRCILNKNFLINKLGYYRYTINNLKSISTTPTVTNDVSSSDSDSSNTSGSSDDSDFESLKFKLLQNSLPHVIKCGWSKEALALGAQECEMSPMMHGLIKNGEFFLVDHFYKSSNEELREYLQQRQFKLKQSEAKLETTPSSPSPSSPPSSSSSPSSSPPSSSSSSSPPLPSSPSTRHLLEDALKFRLQLITPYVNVWPQAMVLMTHPNNSLVSLKNLVNMLDDVWFYAGDKSYDFSWYTKRATLACIYKSTELSLITDQSPNFEETWRFLERRFDGADVFNKCSKQISEAPNTFSSLLQIARNVASMNNLNRN